MLSLASGHLHSDKWVISLTLLNRHTNNKAIVLNISTSNNKYFILFQAGQTNKTVITLVCLNFCTLLLMSSLAFIVWSQTQKQQSTCVCESNSTKPLVDRNEIDRQKPANYPEGGQRCPNGRVPSQGGCAGTPRPNPTKKIKNWTTPIQFNYKYKVYCIWKRVKWMKPKTEISKITSIA